MSNNILFCGDPHGCFANIISAVHLHRPEAVILLGDYNLALPLENYLHEIIGMTQIYWILGNHDFDSTAEYENLFHSALSYNNFHLKVINVGGLRIAGLGSIFMQRVWKPDEPPKWKTKKEWLASQPRVKKIPLHMDNAIWHHEFEAMKKRIRADILVTHEAPSCYKFGFKAIDELAKSIGAKQIFHGHHHVYYRDQLPSGIDVTGVAIGGVTNLAGEQLMRR
jgi:predicted phosphodiesterase